jgi:3-isopropylmalate dehydrogenase
MLLEWLGRRHNNEALATAGKKIDAAIDTAVQRPETRTPDLGGKLGTQAFGKHIASLLN